MAFSQTLLIAKFDLVDAVSNHVTSSLSSLPLDIWKRFETWWLRESNSRKTEDRGVRF